MTLQWLACNVALIVATNVNDPNTAICCCFVSVSGLVRANRSMFPVDEVLRLRTNTESGRLKYVEFLQHYIPTIIGARKWSGVRQVMLVNECFTYSVKLSCFCVMSAITANGCRNILLAMDNRPRLMTSKPTIGRRQLLQMGQQPWKW